LLFNPLPNWLKFDPTGPSLKGTLESAGTFHIKVTATDSGNLSATSKFDIIVKDISQNGTSGSDSLNGNYQNDVINGLAGNDSINGGYGNDFLNGGTGNDYLDGAFGNDTYIFSRGDGSDTISDSLVTPNAQFNQDNIRDRHCASRFDLNGSRYFYY
jgi:Ca2+-binding RTX toxin-like protein